MGGNLVNSDVVSNGSWIKPNPSKAGGLIIGTASHVVTTPNSVHHFTGYLDNIRVYDRGLAQSEIKQLYVEGRKSHPIAQNN